MSDDRTLTLNIEQIRDLLETRIRGARQSKRTSRSQELLDQLCEQCLIEEEILLGMCVASLYNLRVASMEDRALEALFPLLYEASSRVFRHSNPN